MCQSVRRLLSLVLILALLCPMLRFSSFPVAASAQPGRIFLLQDAALLAADQQAPVDIANLKALYESDGHTVTLINASQLAAPASFNANLCDLLVLPYGPQFPYDAMINFKQYVKDGGKVLTLGGYAFTNLVQNEPRHAASVSISSASGDGVWRKAVNISGYSAGSQLTISVWLKTQNIAGAGFAHATIQFYNAAGDFIAAEDYVRKTGTNPWMAVEKTITIPANAATLYLSFGLYQATGSLYFDKVALTETGANRTLFFYEDFEKNCTNRWSTLSYSGNAVFPIVEDAPETLTGASHSLHMNASSASSSQLSLSLNTAEMNTQEQYRFSLWMKGKNVDIAGYAFGSIYFYDVTGTQLSFYDLQAPTGNGKLTKSLDWYQTEYTFQLPQGTARIDVNLGLYHTSGSVYFDKLTLTELSSQNTIFYEDFEGAAYGRQWKQQTYSGAMTVSLSNDTPAVNCALSLTTGNTYTCAFWRRAMPVSLFDTTKTYRVSTVNNVQNIVSSNGSVYNAIHFYNGDTLLATHDFRNYTANTWYWGPASYEFTIPAGTTTVYVDAGFYNAKGALQFDNFRVTDIEGNVVINEDFNTDDDRNNWTTHTAFGTATFGMVNYGDPIILGGNRTRYVGDNALYEADAFPLFDAEHILKNAQVVTASPEQKLFSGSISFADPLEGYSAVTVLGNNRARWQPLLTATDTQGEVKGTVGAIVHIFPKPDTFYDAPNIIEWDAYPGTSLAFFGVTNRDLFASGQTALRDGMKKLVQFLIDGVYLQQVDNKWDNYKTGETPEVVVRIANDSKTAASGIAVVRILEDSTDTVVKTQTVSYQVPAQDVQALTVSWTNASFQDDFYRVEVTLRNSAGEDIDEMSNGFSIWNTTVLNNGLSFTYENNYIHIQRADGTSKAIFAPGVDDGANLLVACDQTALQWQKDMKQRLDAGSVIYECLQQYPIYQPWQRIFADPVQKEKYYRKVDNIVYLSQKYKQIYMMGMAVGNNVAEDEATHQQTLLRVQELVTRYRDVPGIMYYLNGDMLSILSDGIQDEWHEFLSARYATISALNNAWNSSYASFAAVPVEDAYPASGIDSNGSGYGFWGDKKARDYNEFRVWLVTNWTGSLIQAIRQNDPSYVNNPVLCEFYRWPYNGFDVSTAIGELTYSNVGNFETHYTFPEYLQYADLRSIGKSFGVGEFGKRTHPQFSHLDYDTISSTTVEEARNNFFGYMNMGIAMGANHMQYWSWKDESRYIFPWGLRFTGDNVPRDHLYWFRNHNLFTRQLEPQDQAAEVAVLLPDNTRLSGATYGYMGNTLSINCLNILQSAHVGAIATLNENVLANDPNFVIDNRIKTIFYPAPYNPSDAVYNKLKTWVENGGVLYLSGDISYDADYQRTKASRLQYLAGATATQVLYNGLNWHRSSESVRYYDVLAGVDSMSSFTVKPNLRVNFDSSVSVLYRDEANRSVVGMHPLGQGKVIYSAIPMEAFYSSSTQAHMVELYRKVLDNVYGNTRTVFSPDALYMKNFELPLANSGKLICLANISPFTDFSGVYKAKYYQEVPAGYSNLIWTDTLGQIKGVLHQGTFKENDTLISENDCYAFLFARDSQPLITSKHLVILPQTSGIIRIRANAEWDSPSAKAGQITDAVWVEGETVPVTLQNGFLELSVSEENRSKIIILSEPAEQAALAQQLAADLTTL